MDIKISAERYLSLLTSEEILCRLNNGGVDNWEWYGESLYGEDCQDLDEWEQKTKQSIEKGEI